MFLYQKNGPMEPCRNSPQQESHLWIARGPLELCTLYSDPPPYPVPFRTLTAGRTMAEGKDSSKDKWLPLEANPDVS